MSAFTDAHSQMRKPSKIVSDAAAAALHQEIAELLKECTEPQLAQLDYVWPGWRSSSNKADLISITEIVQRTVAKNRAGRE